MYDMNCKFDIEKHKQTYINCLELIIHPDGSIHYAVPSHQMYLESYIEKKNNYTHEEFLRMCPPEKYFDYLNWVIELSNCVCVWNYGYAYYGTLTLSQKISIKKLINSGLLENNIIHV